MAVITVVRRIIGESGLDFVRRVAELSGGDLSEEVEVVVSQGRRSKLDVAHALRSALRDGCAEILRMVQDDGSGVFLAFNASGTLGAFFNESASDDFENELLTLILSMICGWSGSKNETA